MPEMPDPLLSCPPCSSPCPSLLLPPSLFDKTSLFIPNVLCPQSPSPCILSPPLLSPLVLPLWLPLIRLPFSSVSSTLTSPPGSLLSFPALLSPLPYPIHPLSLLLSHRPSNLSCPLLAESEVKRVCVCLGGGTSGCGLFFCVQCENIKLSCALTLSLSFSVSYALSRVKTQRALLL